MKRILLDCSILFRVDAGTGIQRVVKNIVRESMQLHGKNDIVPVFWENGQFKEISQHKLKLILTGQTVVRHTPRAAEITEDSAPKSTTRSRIKAMLPPKIFNLIKRIKGKTRGLLRRLKHLSIDFKQSHDDRDVVFSDNDILVLLDSSWELPLWREVVNAKQCGTKIGFVVYDLIPLRHPEYCDQGLVRFFKQWHVNAFQLADFSMSISDATRQDLINYIKESGGDPKFESKVFKLGADFKPVANIQTEKVDQALQNFMDKKKTFLMVGTIEPRKNHIYVLEAFKKLWGKGIDAKLCFIGKWGWIDEASAKYIKNTEHEYPDFQILTGIDDDGLNFAYKKARATIIASKTEGFGLPIIESLKKETPVIASDIPVFREVGGDSVNYFSTQDEGWELQELIKKKIEEENIKKDKIDWPDWGQSARDFIEKIYNTTR